MTRLVILALFFFCGQSLWAIESDTSLFSYDKQEVKSELKELLDLEKFINENPQATDDEILNVYPALNKMKSLSDYSFYDKTEIAMAGNFPSFWFTFILSAIGSYFIYGAVVGPISVGIVYFSTHKSKTETKKAIWGWILGTLVGLGLWAVFHL